MAAAAPFPQSSARGWGRRLKFVDAVVRVAGPGLGACLTLSVFLTCVSIAGGVVGRASRALGGKTVGSRSAQPGTLSRSPTGDFDHWPAERLADRFDRDRDASVKQTTGVNPAAASGAALDVSQTAS